MKSFGMTDIGRKRKVNQDYLFFSDEPVGCFPNLYIVADGMGGLLKISICGAGKERDKRASFPCYGTASQ